ncbi:MAG: hypothetical protein M1820_009985 [Bogoriella megaspora]|nr:MAG: hypothetical protein M1820_009985 [Bogoriella megaspora]
MPRKKASATNARNAKLSTPEKSRNRHASVEATAASTRSKRSSGAVADESPAAKRVKQDAKSPTVAKPKTRGRPPTTSKEDTETTDTKRKPGRPPKATSNASKQPAKNVKAPATKPAVKKGAKTAVGSDSATTGRRGRPPKSQQEAPKKVKPEPKKRSALALTEADTEDDAEAETAEPPAKRQRGRAPKSKQAQEEVQDASDQDDDLVDEGPSYWLMKAEPESRIEKGVDVKFSIDDLQAVDEPEPWNGVRNHQAKNNLKAMKKGEQAFFYHSNCKTPGIVGIMEIVKEASEDESAFDEDNPYYDPKAKRGNPNGWVVVHVEFRQKFVEPITLETLKSLAKEHEELENIQVLNRARLSVSKVTPEEWNFILKQVEAETTTVPDGADETSATTEGVVGSSEAAAQLNGEAASASASASTLAPPKEAPKRGTRAPSAPPSAKKDTLALPKKAGSRSNSRAHSVPPSGPTAETGPAPLKETPIAQAMEKVMEE